MDRELLEKLRKWRERIAKRQHVELYRIVSTQSLEEIARNLPKTKDELLKIKGIKEKKFARYGKDILEIVRGDGDEFIETFKEEEKIFGVSEYLDILNDKLAESEARVKGEISSFEHRGNYIFFGIKDTKDESLINCFMWDEDYALSGIELEEGMEVIIWGYPNIYKPSGRFSFQTKLVELVGEGLLKKAYEELKRKLEAEGIFAPERKRPLPDYIHRIGLITSHQGAAIGDFISNVGNYGYKIKFYNSRVEGKQAIFDLISGIRFFNENDDVLDILVIARGGGSLESLQAFNSEALVREVANSKIPILAGIGHEKDVSLVALAADAMVSTPTAAANLVRSSWDEAEHKVARLERELVQHLEKIFRRFEEASQKIHLQFEKLSQSMEFMKERINKFPKEIAINFLQLLATAKEKVNTFEKQLNFNNPERQLKLGYSIVLHRGKIVTSIEDIAIGDEIKTKVKNGEFNSIVKNKSNL